MTDYNYYVAIVDQRISSLTMDVNYRWTFKFKESHIPLRKNGNKKCVHKSHLASGGKQPVELDVAQTLNSLGPHFTA